MFTISMHKLNLASHHPVYKCQTLKGIVADYTINLTNMGECLCKIQQTMCNCRSWSNKLAYLKKNGFCISINKGWTIICHTLQCHTLYQMSLDNVVTMFNKTIYLKIVVIFTLTFLNISIQSEYSDVTSNIPSANFSKNTNSTTNAIRNSTTFPPYPYHHLLTTNNINSPKVSNAVLHYKQSENAKTIRGIQNKGTRRKEGLF